MSNMKKLMIVESPGKVKSIKAYLGDGWVVAASVGHVRDLPPNELGVDIENNFRPKYELTERGRGVVTKLRQLAANADEVYLATDLDREGEAIAWHLKVALGLKDYRRVTFSEISKAALQHAIANPRKINNALVEAQEARRVLDRLVGFRVSPALSTVFNRRGLSAGRVQTPALGLVVKRELAIQSFVATSYFDVYLVFGENTQNPWSAKWDPEPHFCDGQTHWTDRDVANQIAQILNLRVVKYEAKPQAQHPHAPLITSTLQQSASVALKISPKDTMKLAQTLYEQGLITYHRTDFPNLSDGAAQLARAWLKGNGFSQDINPTVPHWKSREGAQEAHEAIRPVDFNIRTLTIADPDRARLQALYDLIWNYAVASQMKPAIYDTQLLVLAGQHQSKDHHFYARARALRYAGWHKLTSATASIEDASDDEDDDTVKGIPQNRQLPVLDPGVVMQASRGQVVACKTKPPNRYTEASLGKELEKLGVGRPATYAAITSGLLDRNFIELKKRKLFASLGGISIIDVVEICAFADTGYTSNIEARLDLIVNGKDRYLSVVSALNQQLDQEIEKLSQLKRVFPETETGNETKKPTSKKKSTKGTKPGTNTSSQRQNSAKHKDGDPCPVCKKSSVIYKTVKSGKNEGKHFYGCSDRGCTFFAWASQAS